MKSIIKILAAVLAVHLSNIALAEVVVRKEPITREQSALSLSGQQLYKNLCAACHGAEATGQGKACESLGIHAPDLTRIASENGGVFPGHKVKDLIANNPRQGMHGNAAMPEWEKQFVWVKSGLSSHHQRKLYARNRIHALAKYIEEIQVP